VKVIDCDHHLQKWVATPDCYELHCAICGKKLDGKTYFPGTLEVFEFPTVTYDLARKERDK